MAVVIFSVDVSIVLMILATSARVTLFPGRNVLSPYPVTRPNPTAWFTYDAYHA